METITQLLALFYLRPGNKSFPCAPRWVSDLTYGRVSKRWAVQVSWGDVFLGLLLNLCHFTPVEK